MQYIELQNEYKERQKGLVEKILKLISGYYPAMEKSSQLISELDVLSSFASTAVNNKFVKPKINLEGNLIIRKSKHPCLYAQNSDTCVPNDCVMVQDSSKFHIITGPNMVDIIFFYWFFYVLYFSLFVILSSFYYFYQPHLQVWQY